MESVKIIVIDQGHTIAYETYCLLIEVLNDTRIELESLSPADCTGDTIYTYRKNIFIQFIFNYFRGGFVGNERSAA